MIGCAKGFEAGPEGHLVSVAGLPEIGTPFEDLNLLALGDQVTCQVGPFRYRGKVVRKWGDAFSGDIAEIELDCGFKTTRTFPELTIVSARHPLS
ncbi:MAG: hypothetical protein ACM3KM_02745 [Acidobacteriaceae bacterium]